MLPIFFGYILDLIFGDPYWMPHPVKGIGWVISKTECFLRKRFRNLKLAGILLASFVILVTYLVVKFIIWDFKTVAPVILIYLAISIKDLKDEAYKIYGYLQAGDLEKARQRVSRIVGRDTKDLDSEQLIRATVESVADSAVDGVVAVLFYAFLGGPVLAWVYKAINTLDSAVGHRNIYYKEIGWFSAKLDSIFNYIPSRITAALIFIRHSTPESAFAARLGVQLGGLSYYDGMPVHKPYVGEPRNKLKPGHIKEAVKLMYISSAVMMAVMIIVNYLWNFVL